MINIPKGTKDVLPSESYKWQYAEERLRKVAKLYNAREIRTPTFEHTELFVRSIGDETDVVSKEMYTFEDKGGRSITLRPEGTASVARSYVENSLEAMSLPLKTYYIISAFRYERPQAGRLREFHQFGAEIYGTFLDGLDIYTERITPRGVIVMGNEGGGISDAVAVHVTRRLFIPSFGDGAAESLNVSVATAVVCSEFRRRG